MLRDDLNTTIFSLALILAFGGGFTFLIARFLYYLVKLLYFFELSEAPSQRLLKIMWCGAAAALIGSGILYLQVTLRHR